MKFISASKEDDKITMRFRNLIHHYVFVGLVTAIFWGIRGYIYLNEIEISYLHFIILYAAVMIPLLLLFLRLFADVDVIIDMKKRIIEKNYLFLKAVVYSYSLNVDKITIEFIRTDDNNSRNFAHLTLLMNLDTYWIVVYYRGTWQNFVPLNTEYTAIQVQEALKKLGYKIRIKEDDD
jgi:hypothetical protein